LSNHNSGIKVKSALISFPMLKLSHYVDRKPGKAGKIPREKLGSDYELNIDESVKNLFLPLRAQSAQRKYFKLQYVTSACSVVSVVDFQFLRNHQHSKAEDSS